MDQTDSREARKLKHLMKTTRLINSNLGNTLDDGKWNEMREEGYAWRAEAWRVKPPTKRKVLTGQDKELG